MPWMQRDSLGRFFAAGFCYIGILSYAMINPRQPKAYWVRAGFALKNLRR